MEYSAILALLSQIATKKLNLLKFLQQIKKNSTEEALQCFVWSQSDTKSHLNSLQCDRISRIVILVFVIPLFFYSIADQTLCDICVFPVMKAFVKLEITIHSERCNLEKELNVCENWRRKSSRIKGTSMHRKTQFDAKWILDKIYIQIYF